FDHRGSAAGAGARKRFADDLAYRDDVIAVDLNAGNPGSDRLLRQRPGRGLLFDRKRDCPMIVADDEDRRQIPHAGEIDRFVEIAFRRSAVAERTDRDARLAAQLESGGDTDGMRGLTSDR